MLGALGMSIDECITEYLELAPKIFEEDLLARQKPARLFKKVQAKARFDASALETEIKRLVQSYCQLDPDIPLVETLKLANSCKITVCSTHLNVTKPAQLRNYSSSWEPPVDCSIWQAARSTSAAPLFFDPITFGVPPKTYGDWALHYNNPIRVLLDESKRIWNYETERKAGIIVSVGTGRPKLRGFGDGLYQIVQSLEAIVTDTQETEEMFANEIADLPLSERPHYYRFNVDQGLEDIGLEEWKEFQKLTEATDAYLRAHRRDIESCVEAFLSLIENPRMTSRGLLLSDFPLKTDQFFGRATELFRIAQCLEGASSSTQKRVAINGFPGSGKTQLTLEYALGAGDKYFAYLWINAESKTSIEQSSVSCVGTICSKFPAYRDLANHLDPFDLVLAWLQTPAHYPWLIFIDGLDDLVPGKRLIQYCTGHGGGAVCVTSTHANISAAFKIDNTATIRLGPLQPLDSRSLFLARAQSIDQNTGTGEEDDAIRSALKILDGFPLAIELAGILVREGIVSLNDFPAMYKTQHQKVTDITPDHGQWFWDKEKSLFKMFGMLYESLSAKSPCAAMILTLCSVYGTWAAPMSLFQHLSLLPTSTISGLDTGPCTELRQLSRDTLTLNMAIYELHRRFLAIRKQDTPSREIQNISLHGSILRWRFANLDRESKAEWTMQASYALANHFWDCYNGKSPSNSTESDLQQPLIESSVFKVARPFIDPAERCITAIKENVPADALSTGGLYDKPYFMICFYMGHMFLAVGNPERSKELFVGAKQRMYLSENVKDSVRLLRGLATSCQQTGDLTAAKEALEAALRLDDTIEQRMDDDALEIVALLKSVRDRLDADLSHRKRALIASVHPKLTARRSESEDVPLPELSDIHGQGTTQNWDTYDSFANFGEPESSGFALSEPAVLEGGLDEAEEVLFWAEQAIKCYKSANLPAADSLMSRARAKWRSELGIPQPAFSADELRQIETAKEDRHHRRDARLVSKVLDCMEAAFKLGASGRLPAADSFMSRARKYWRSDLGIPQPSLFCMLQLKAVKEARTQKAEQVKRLEKQAEDCVQQKKFSQAQGLMYQAEACWHSNLGIPKPAFSSDAQRVLDIEDVLKMQSHARMIFHFPKSRMLRILDPLEIMNKARERWTPDLGIPEPRFTSYELREWALFSTIREIEQLMDDAQRKLTFGKTDAAQESIKQAKELWSPVLGIHEPAFPSPKDGKSGKRLRGLGNQLRKFI